MPPYQPLFKDCSLRIFYFPLLSFERLSVPLSKAAILLPRSYLEFFYFMDPPFEKGVGLPYTACYGPAYLPNVLLPLVYIPLSLVYFCSPPNTFLYSIGTIPKRVNKSAIRFPLIFWSKGESHPRDGLKLTSISQACSMLSIIISNPKSSKQFDDEGTYWSKAELI